MGVEFRIDLYAENRQIAENAVKKAFERISELNQIMSDYIVESELWQLSESSGKGVRVKVSPELWEILSYSKKVHTQSSGAFDITAGPYFLLWRQARVIKRLPSERSMQRAANKVGMDKLVMYANERSVELKASGMRLDLGGVAKGHAADEALKILQEAGIEYAFVDGSGDIAMTEPYDKPWKVFVSDGLNEATEYVSLESGALATSGDTYQFVEIGGKRYSHIVNPVTGIGITNRCRVTIYAKSCKTADAMASAVSVLGPEKGLKLVESIEGVEALILKQEVDGKRYYKSSGFPELNKK